MEAAKLYLSSPNLVAICMDGFSEGEGYGRIYHMYSRKPFCFSTELMMVEGLESLFDHINYPQSSLKKRRFFEAREAGSRNPRAESPARLQSEEEVAGHMGNVATFVVNVQHRQHASWQGTVLWAEKKEKRSFRSALELIRMMDEAINWEGGEPKPEQGGGTAS